MKFNEANKIVEAFDEDPELEDWMPDSKVYEIIEGLREEYAPTVEMTQRQARIFKLYYDSEKPFDKSEFEDIDNYFMKSINEKDLMQAWLHPESIKVVNNEQ